ncbi:CBS domain-containing protein [candidate division KSB1 bacterium]|nr:CBS domain-containing protein [candidate division KSB1 bacterium]NIR71216.1 CBS domain-containing protein [candidate division KSB1 bacterium]NIS23320.1 CBS domain-containing protein [candidate division KSB1 bacterium]NIT70199.1 CBS domain-containing protein [candidate division KSB1 bacterium]NIU23851.1 CBS domain-containing protein [candidate division KSB1 bacterium]
MFPENLTAKQIMTSPVITVRDNRSVEEVSDLFIDNMISGAPVVNKNGRPVGVITLTDIVRNEKRRENIVSDKIASDYILRDYETSFNADELGSGYHIEEGETLLVRDIMTPFVYRVKEDAPVKELAEIMTSGRIHRLFVTRDDEIVGIVTSLDFLKAVVKYSK